MSENCELVEPSSRWSLDLIGPLTYIKLGSALAGIRLPRPGHSQMTPDGQRAHGNKRERARPVNRPTAIMRRAQVGDTPRPDETRITESSAEMRLRLRRERPRVHRVQRAAEMPPRD